MRLERMRSTGSRWIRPATCTSRDLVGSGFFHLTAYILAPSKVRSIRTTWHGAMPTAVACTSQRKPEFIGFDSGSQGQVAAHVAGRLPKPTKPECLPGEKDRDQPLG